MKVLQKGINSFIPKIFLKALMYFNASWILNHGIRFLQLLGWRELRLCFFQAHFDCNTSFCSRDFNSKTTGFSVHTRVSWIDFWKCFIWIIYMIRLLSMSIIHLLTCSFQRAWNELDHLEPKYVYYSQQLMQWCTYKGGVRGARCSLCITYSSWWLF